jgi:hypothetical protein
MLTRRTKTDGVLSGTESMRATSGGRRPGNIYPRATEAEVIFFFSFAIEVPELTSGENGLGWKLKDADLFP